MNIEIIKGDDNPVAEFFSSPARPTPETDAATHDLSDYGSPVLCSWGDWVDADFARKLERGRDEAIEKHRFAVIHWQRDVFKMQRERDEAQKQCNELHEQIEAMNRRLREP